MKVRYTLLQPTYGPGYESLIDALSSLSRYCSFVVREFDEKNHEIESFIKQIEAYEDRRDRVSEWPGTCLLQGETALLYTYRLDPKLVSILKSEVSSLFSWSTPTLPEDLCFYREDRSCLLATISHEKDVYVELSEDELSRFQTRVPEFQVSSDAS
jgi:hypothetical protein